MDRGQLQLAKDNGVMLHRAWRDYSNEAVEIRRMVCAFRRSVINADRSKSKRKN